MDWIFVMFAASFIAGLVTLSAFFRFGKAGEVTPDQDLTDHFKSDDAADYAPR